MADATSQTVSDPLPLAQALIRRPSVTPLDAGALDVLEAALKPLGFVCRRMKFGEIDNLYAKLGAGRPHLCFAGHTDVVPVGDVAAWSVDPFAAEVRDGKLIGRGAADMKAAIAAFVSAVAANGAPKGAISFLITGDEEGPAIDGTKKVLDALVAEGEHFDHCLVGEPTTVSVLGDTVKNGRRGSYNAVVTVEGKQGHAAYPHLSLNPVPILLDVLNTLRARKLDDGAPGFDPSNLEITSVDVGNPAHNVIPAKASARFNVRFNTHHTGASLAEWTKQVRDEAQAKHPHAKVSIEGRATGEAFFTQPSAFTDLILDAAHAVTGKRGGLSTSGGTSDARFIHAVCPVAELGLCNDTAHKVDEFIEVEDLRKLAQIYARLIADYFAKF